MKGYLLFMLVLFASSGVALSSSWDFHAVAISPSLWTLDFDWSNTNMFDNTTVVTGTICQPFDLGCGTLNGRNLTFRNRSLTVEDWNIEIVGCQCSLNGTITRVDTPLVAGKITFVFMHPSYGRIVGNGIVVASKS